MRDRGAEVYREAIKSILQKEMHGIKHRLQDNAYTLVVVVVIMGCWERKGM